LKKKWSEWNDIVMETSHHLVALEPTIDEAVKLIREQSNTLGSHYSRKAPLVISRLARGGKTTVLIRILQKLKKMGYPALFISFSSYNFQRRKNETDSEAILRQIALKLMDPVPLRESTNFFCEEKILEEKIQQAIEETKLPFVLLIDGIAGVNPRKTIQKFFEPCDSKASDLLKRLFLDPKSRYLVYGSYFPHDLDQNENESNNFTKSSSKRGIRTINLPFTTSIAELNAMYSPPKTLPIAHILLYLGIPSLIFCAERGRICPMYNVQCEFIGIRGTAGSVASKDRFTRFISQIINGKQFTSVDPAMKNPSKIYYSSGTRICMLSTLLHSTSYLRISSI
jgi:hypothetical protein